MEGTGSVTSLVTVFLDGSEISKKIHQLNTVGEILTASKHLLNCDAECDRLLKFHTDFNEYIDTEIDSSVQNLDKYHILFKSITQNDSNKQLAKQDQPRTTNAACSRSQRETEHQNDGPRLDASGLTQLLERKAPKLLQEYKTSGTLALASRQLLVKLCVSHLVELKGFYPSKADKVLLARNIITVFPALKIQMVEENEGFEHFYDPVSHSGFIEFKLRNLRRKIDDDKRRYCKRGRSSHSPSVVTLDIAEIEDESIMEWTSAIKRMKPSPENMATIKMGMEKTFTNRRLWIASQAPTLQEIFQHYPRFVDLPCLLDVEFGKLLPGKQDLFLRKWEAHCVPKLLKVATLENYDNILQDTEENGEARAFRALQILTHLLPPIALGRGKGWSKCSVKSALSYILDIKPTGTSLSSLMEGSLDSTAQQPKLVCLGQPSDTAQYIIVAKNDKVVIPLEDEGLTCAIDKLFKMFWVCNLTYPAQVQSVYQFFEYIYDIHKPNATRSKVAELVAKLQAVL